MFEILENIVLPAAILFTALAVVYLLLLSIMSRWEEKRGEHGWWSERLQRMRSRADRFFEEDT